MTQLPNDPLDGSDKYRAIRELGRGGMGEVFLAEHINLGSKVVVKLLHVELSARTALVDRMRLEAQALARLNHPNIVRVSDFDRTPKGRPFFVMEYLPGRSLREEVVARGGSLPFAEAISVVQQALAGLAYAHGTGLVHRDLKLDNLFVCDAAADANPLSRVIKILDFGVAKVLHGGDDAPSPLAVPTRTGMVVGTPRFFAPEQARGKKLDHRADLYSMGMVLYSLLAGRGPFDEATNLTEMAKAHVLQVPNPPSAYASQQLPSELDAIVLKTIEKKPEQRYQSATELSQALQQLMATVAGPSSLDVSASEMPTARHQPVRDSQPQANPQQAALRQQRGTTPMQVQTPPPAYQAHIQSHSQHQRPSQPYDPAQQQRPSQPVVSVTPGLTTTPLPPHAASSGGSNPVPFGATTPLPDASAADAARFDAARDNFAPTSMQEPLSVAPMSTAAMPPNSQPVAMPLATHPPAQGSTKSRYSAGIAALILAVAALLGAAIALTAAKFL